MPTPSASDIDALDVTGNVELARQWPPLVRSIQYLQTLALIAAGADGDPQNVTLVNGSADGASKTVLFVSPEGYSTLTPVIDNFTHIPVTNYQAGQIIFVSPGNTGTSPNFNALRVTGQVGGDGQINLKGESANTAAGAVRFYMNDPDQVLCLQLRGTQWYELFRAGREIIRDKRYSGTPANPPLLGEVECRFHATWTTGSKITYYKDSLGDTIVSLRLEAAADLTTTSYPVFEVGFPFPATYANPSEVIVHGTVIPGAAGGGSLPAYTPALLTMPSDGVWVMSVQPGLPNTGAGSRTAGAIFNFRVSTY